MRPLFLSVALLVAASGAGCIDPFGTYNGGSTGGGTLSLPTDGGDSDGGTTGTIIGTSYDCSAQVAVSQLLPAGCAGADEPTLAVGTMEWVCAGGAGVLSFSDFTLSGSVTSTQGTFSGSRLEPSGGDGQYEAVSVSVNLATNGGQLTYERTLGAAGAAICQATGSLTVE